MRLDSEVMTAIRPYWGEIENTVQVNSLRVVEAFAESGLSQQDLAGSTGYGYDDRGREALDAIYAQVFGAERAVVRPQWVSGTHVLATVLRALLASGEVLGIVGGRLYDTLRTLVGDDHAQSLGRRGVQVIEIEADEDGHLHLAGTAALMVVFIQRSRGYSLSRCWSRKVIERMIHDAHQYGATVVVDNCYGEFTEQSEPSAWGADLIAGSLLKNPGGALAPTGGYVAGRSSIVERVADELMAPTMGSEVGPTGAYLRPFAQGFFLAPQVVGEALMGATYLRQRWSDAGYRVEPMAAATTEMITAIALGSAASVAAFCAAVQSAGPVDSRAVPEPWSMPGYADPVIMAAPGMIAGASLELSCDAPMRSPYWVYVQGGVHRWHTIYAAEKALTCIDQ